jgi:AraC family transcriptional regulator
MNILITYIEPQLLSGRKIWTSIASQETSKLWRPFSQSIREKEGLSPAKFYSIGRYGKEMSQGNFTEDSQFEKCAAIIEPISSCPKDFEEIRLEGGLYAVFSHLGSIAKFQSTLQEFILIWLPKSNYRLDDRAHFETFDETYDPFTDDSVELVHIPIIEKVGFL